MTTAARTFGRTGPVAVRVPDEVVSLTPFVEAGVLGPAEVHLAGWIARTGGVDDPHLALAAAMAAWAAQHGHSCAALGELAEVVAREAADRSGVDDVALAPTVAWPDHAVWVAALRALPDTVIRVVDGFDPVAVLDARPLVLHGDRVYLQRHWADECTAAASVRERAVPIGSALSPAAAVLLDRLLPAVVDGEPNLQRCAADLVVADRLAVIAGGPGTGKTYSVARLLAVLLADAGERDHPLRIALAAPTGKAAARLQESIAAALEQPEMRDAVPEPVRDTLGSLVPTTIHRMLGPLGDRRHRFRHDASNPLPHDVVVVDETSMVSLPLLARTLEAVRPESRLVLIGDPDQLESVELGAVLGDLVAAAGAPSGPLVDRVVRLVRGHRFGGGSPIALLADAVRRGDEEVALTALRAGVPGLRFVETADPTQAQVVEVVRTVIDPLLGAVRTAAEAGRAEEALAASLQARVLCAHRLGPFGVSHWNELGERWLCGPRGAGAGVAWYPGRPLLVTRNDARLRLSNGDTGVVVRERGRLVAVFATAGGLLRYDPVQLADVETAYAMTVHKSQGSEYPTVVMVLPPATSPLAGRELVYTGVTRAKETLVVVGAEDSVRTCVATPARRMTGLAGALRDE